MEKDACRHLHLDLSCLRKFARKGTREFRLSTGKGGSRSCQCPRPKWIKLHLDEECTKCEILPGFPSLVNCTRDVAVSRHRRLGRIADADGVREEREGREEETKATHSTESNAPQYRVANAVGR